MLTYDQPLLQTVSVAASAVLSSAAVAKRIIGPAGCKGRVLALNGIVTTGVTDAAGSLTIGTAADPDSIMTTSVAIAAANTGFSATAAQVAAAAELAADTVYQLAGGGEATAGAADIHLVIGWFK